MIKIGDWVKVNKFNRVVKVISINANILWYYLDDAKMFAVEDDLTKLPIKFNGFNVLFRTDGDREVWDCYRTVKEIGTIHFICIFDSIQFYTGYKIKYEKFIDVNLQTAEEAELWLELQYATLLAKARGLV